MEGKYTARLHAAILKRKIGRRQRNDIFGGDVRHVLVAQRTENLGGSRLYSHYHAEDRKNRNKKKLNLSYLLVLLNCSPVLGS